MEIIYSPQAINDLNYWKRSGNKVIQKRIETLLVSMMKTPFEGIGNPKPLKYELSGYWSRRINKEHRIVYQVLEENKVIILEVQSLKDHY